MKFNPKLHSRMRCGHASLRMVGTAPQVPILIGVVILYAAASYWLVGMRPTAGAFAMFTLVLCLVVLTGFSLCQLISACVSTVERAIAIYMLLLVYSLLLGGFIIGPKALPQPAKPLLYTSFYYWGFEALCVNEFGSTADGEKTLADLGFTGVSIWHNVIILAGFVLVLRAFAFVALWRTRY